VRLKSAGYTMTAFRIIAPYRRLMRKNLPFGLSNCNPSHE